MVVALQPMNEARLGPWMEAIKADYIESRVQAGETEALARDNADRSFESSFDRGRPRPGHHVYDVLADGTVVGYLWVGPQVPPQPGAWWVWDIVIHPEHQRRGYGRQAMLLGEAVVRDLGGTVLGLNVFGFNTGARSLYESLGYQTTAVQMRKSLQPEPQEGAG